MSEFCTYITHHPKTLKFYVGKGKTKLVESGQYKGSGTLLTNSFKKYPKTEWVTLVISKFNTSQAALDHEARIVTKDFIKHPLCLNLVAGGNSAPICSPETRALIVKNNTGRRNSEEAKKNMSIAALNRKPRDCSTHPLVFTEEHRRKISEAQKKIVRKPASDETKAKMSKSRLGLTRTKEQCDNISVSLKGRVLTEEHKLALRKPKAKRVKTAK